MKINLPLNGIRAERRQVVLLVNFNTKTYNKKYAIHDEKLFQMSLLNDKFILA